MRPKGTPLAPPQWDVVITEWALDSYLNVKHARTFTDAEYRTVLRPDVERLHAGIPSPDPKLANPKFWGPAKVGNTVLPNGYKMKWHQIGPGRVQLRLPVTTGTATAFLCECYVKENAHQERRKLARFTTHINLISQGRYVFRGKL